MILLLFVFFALAVDVLVAVVDNLVFKRYCCHSCCFLCCLRSGSCYCSRSCCYPRYCFFLFALLVNVIFHVRVVFVVRVA